jgi:hypothetical protein
MRELWTRLQAGLWVLTVLALVASGGDLARASRRAGIGLTFGVRSLLVQGARTGTEVVRTEVLETLGQVRARVFEKRLVPVAPSPSRVCNRSAAPSTAPQTRVEREAVHAA